MISVNVDIWRMPIWSDAMLVDHRGVPFIVVEESDMDRGEFALVMWVEVDVEILGIGGVGNTFDWS